MYVMAYSIHSYRQQSTQVKTTIYSKEAPATDMINMNNFDMEAKEFDITLDENYQEIPIEDPVQLLFATLKELMSHRNRHTSTGNKVYVVYFIGTQSLALLVFVLTKYQLLRYCLSKTWWSY